MSEHLITGSGPLLDEEGRLREPGYALKPPFEYAHEQIAAPAWRLKCWDYYLVQDAHYAIALTFSDLGYIGLISAAVLDLDAPSQQTTSELVLFPMGRMGLPASSDEGDIDWHNRRCDVSFTHVEGGRRLSFAMKRFENETVKEISRMIKVSEPRVYQLLDKAYKIIRQNRELDD